MEPGKTLSVKLDEGEDLKPSTMQGAQFFHGSGADGRTCLSGESADVACHEMGHAILDAVKPELWDAASQEAAAFHEGFGDISAILSALQLQSLRTAILKETTVISTATPACLALPNSWRRHRAQAPDAVEPDCLRNAVNRLPIPIQRSFHPRTGFAPLLRAASFSL